VVTVRLQDVTSLTSFTPTRCRFDVNVSRSTPLRMDDAASTENNVTTIEVESIDHNDPEPVVHGERSAGVSPTAGIERLPSALCHTRLQVEASSPVAARRYDSGGGGGSVGGDVDLSSSIWRASTPFSIPDARSRSWNSGITSGEGPGWSRCPRAWCCRTD
jgi:hypothetical protein